MEKARFFISSTYFPRTQINPLFSGLFEFSQENEEAYYSHEPKDDFKIHRAADYNLLLLAESDECAKIILEVEVFENSVYSLYWEGSFSWFDCSVDKDKCSITFKPSRESKYLCYESALPKEQNIFSYGSAITITAIGGTYETQLCTDTALNADCGDYYAFANNPSSACLADPTRWCLKSNVVLIDGFDTLVDCSRTDMILEQQTTWHREVVTTTCVGGSPVSPSFGSGWALVSNDCGGSNTATWWRCPASSGGVPGDYTRGRLFSDIITGLVAGMDCTLTIKSDFFNINPVGDAPSNKAYTFAQENLHYLSVHQKSDIKRKTASNGSTSASWNIKVKDWFEDLYKLFFVLPTIEGDTLILEHYSFYQASLGLNLVGKNTPNKYNFSGNSNVGTERFFYLDEDSSTLFRSQPIEYDCGTEEKEHRLRLFSTDVLFIENELNSERVTDKGFVLCSNDFYNGGYVLKDSNLPLSWPELNENLHAFGRPYKSGKINGVQQVFESFEPYKKQEVFSTYICSTDFLPENLIQTEIGQGKVQVATYNIFTGKIELELAY